MQSFNKVRKFYNSQTYCPKIYNLYINTLKNNKFVNLNLPDRTTYVDKKYGGMHIAWFLPKQ